MNKLSQLDLEKLDKAIDNPKNDKVINIDLEKLNELNSKILKELNIPKGKRIEMEVKLKEYVFIDELDEIEEGGFIKWINLDPVDSIIKLREGGIIIGYELGKEGVLLKCKNFKHRFFSLSLEKNIIFQKLSRQQLILLSALKFM